jgi:hypothetical protein
MIVRPVVVALVLAALILAAASGLRFAEGAGMVGADGARRIMQVLIGLVFAGYANFMPKRLKRTLTSPRAESQTQSVLRVGGWSLTLAGLAYAGLWAFAPLAIANIASMAVVVAATVTTIGYALWSCTSHAGHSDASVPR